MSEVIKRGRLFVISAPSGSGKSTLCGMMMKALTNISYSVSYTTRQPRGKEVSGIDYHFVSKDEFKRMVDDKEFLEWAEVHGNYYGTSARTVSDALFMGRDILLDIDPQGALQLKSRIKNAVYIFITAPSISILRERLIKRGTDDDDTIKLRLENAKQEVEYFADYDYLIRNDESNKAFEDLKAIYRAEKLRTIYMTKPTDFMDI